MQYSKVTHVGLVRKGNEDSLCFDEDLNLYGVADGMGGHEAGEVASDMAVQAVIGHLRRQQQWALVEPSSALATAIREANQLIFDKAEQSPTLRGMGTTIAVGLIRDNRLSVGHVGDSRVYLLRDGKLHQVTQDHSLVNQLLINGGITEEEAFTHPQRNVLIRALGTSQEVEVDITEVQLQVGDRILFCTDGLSGCLRKEELQAVLNSSPSVTEVVDTLLSRALDAGGPDNITIVLVEVE